MSKCNCGKECGCIVRCSFTDCIYNSACCINPSDADTYCTLKEIDLVLDEETGIMDCSQYQRTDKPYECMDCQLKKCAKYLKVIQGGTIHLNDEITAKL